MVDFLVADHLGREPQIGIDREPFEARIRAARQADEELETLDIANDQHRLQKMIEFYRESAPE